MVLDIGGWLTSAALDTLYVVPFLLVGMFLVEYVSHRSGDGLIEKLNKFGWLGSVAGAGLGLIPGSGMSVLGARLFNTGTISAGTLLAIMLASGDSSLLVLARDERGAAVIGTVILTKVIIAVIAGLVMDFLWGSGRRAYHYKCTIKVKEEADRDSWGHMTLGALQRTLVTSAILMFMSFVLYGFVAIIGEDGLSRMLLSGNTFQPFMVALLGIIPNQAVSVFLAEMYLQGSISFASAISGFAASSGLGLIALAQGMDCRKSRIAIFFALYFVAAGAGMLLQLLGG